MKIARVSRTASLLPRSRALRLSRDAASVVLALALALVGCAVADDGGDGSGGEEGSTSQVSADDAGTAGADTGDGDGDGDGDSACAFPLVALQTGQDSTCAGGNVHTWPIGMAPEDCHGWVGVDNMGQEHANSANAIGCNADSTFTFTQFAGNLDCSGGGVEKVFTMGVCEQDIPPVLYTLGLNLACCLDPSSPDCVTAIPSVEVQGGSVYLNGVACE